MQVMAEVEPDYAFLARVDRSARGGTTDHVQILLREAIVAAELPPGCVINKHALCERLGVSRFPVSEALTRLQAEGLVEILPQRGTRVTPIRMRDVREAMFIRRALETEVMRNLAAALPEGLDAALARNLRYQAASVEVEDRRGFHELDLEFHQILVDALGFVRVPGLVETARGGLERVRRLLSSPTSHGEALREHAAIRAALRVGDAEGAAAAMAGHLDRVIASLAAFGRAHPGVVDDA